MDKMLKPAFVQELEAAEVLLKKLETLQSSKFRMTTREIEALKEAEQEKIDKAKTLMEEINSLAKPGDVQKLEKAIGHLSDVLEKSKHEDPSKAEQGLASASGNYLSIL